MIILIAQLAHISFLWSWITSLQFMKLSQSVDPNIQTLMCLYLGERHLMTLGL